MGVISSPHFSLTASQTGSTTRVLQLKESESLSFSSTTFSHSKSEIFGEKPLQKNFVIEQFSTSSNNPETPKSSYFMGISGGCRYISGDPIQYADPSGLSPNDYTIAPGESAWDAVGRGTQMDYVNGLIDNQFGGDYLNQAVLPERIVEGTADILKAGAVGVIVVGGAVITVKAGIVAGTYILSNGGAVITVSASKLNALMASGGTALWMRGNDAMRIASQQSARIPQALSKTRNFFLRGAETFRLPANINFRPIKKMVMDNLGVGYKEAAQFVRLNYNQANGYIHYGGLNRVEKMSKYLSYDLPAKGRSAINMTGQILSRGREDITRLFYQVITEKPVLDLLSRYENMVMHPAIGFKGGDLLEGKMSKGKMFYDILWMAVLGQQDKVYSLPLTLPGQHTLQSLEVDPVTELEKIVDGHFQP